MKAIRPEPSLTDRVFDQLRSAIISGQLVPGELHSVKSLADSLEVSRTPVREALIDLASMGMVKFERNRGVRILETSVNDLAEIFELRLMLEVPAVYRAVEQAGPERLASLRQHFDSMLEAAVDDDETALMEHDRRFHLEIFAMSGNELMGRILDQLRDLILMRGASTVGRSRSLHEVCEQHRHILEAVEAGDAGAAADCMRTHVLETGRLLIEQEHGMSSLSSWAALWQNPDRAAL